METIKDTIKSNIPLLPDKSFFKYVSIKDPFVICIFAILTFFAYNIWMNTVYSFLRKKYPNNQISAIKLRKATISAYNIAFYILSFCWGLFCILSYRPQLLNFNANYPISNKSLWAQLEYPHPTPIYLFYMFQLGALLTNFYVLLFVEPRSSDFMVYVVHHCVAFTLILSSYVRNWMNAGLGIVYLHDFSDIFLHLGKLLNYIGNPRSSTIAFTVFVLTFAINRIYYYPQVVWSCFKDVYVKDNAPRFEHLYFLFFLASLLVIHTIWFAMILNSIQKSWKNKKIVDAQEAGG